LPRRSLETKRLFVARNEKAAWDQIPAAFRFSEISLATNQPQTSADFKSIRNPKYLGLMPFASHLFSMPYALRLVL